MIVDVLIKEAGASAAMDETAGHAVRFEATVTIAIINQRLRAL